MCETLHSLALAVGHEIEALVSNERRTLNARQPAVTLPIEILQTIFELACALTTSTSEPYGYYTFRVEIDDFRNTRAAINLTCSRWREVALKSVGLWSHISMLCHIDPQYPEDYDYGDEDGHRQTGPVQESAPSAGLNIIPLEVERARGRPLLVYLHSSFLPTTPNNSKSSAAADLAIQLAQRCTKYYMDAESDIFSSPTNLPLLRTFVLNIQYVGKTVFPFVPPFNFSQAPSLEKLCLTHGRCSRHPLIFVVPEFSSITTLYLGGELDSASVVCAINSSPQLVTLHLGCFPNDLHTAPSLLPLVHLRNLSVTGDLAAACMPSLSAPNLVQLSVQPPRRNRTETLMEEEVWSMPNHVFTPSRFPSLRYLEVLSRVECIEVLLSFITSHQHLERIWFDLPLDEELYSFFSGLGSAGVQSVWAHVNNWADEDYEVGWISGLLEARAQMAATSTPPLPFALNLGRGQYRSLDEESGRDSGVFDLVRRYRDGPVTLSLRDYTDDEEWAWIEHVFA